MTMSEMKGWLKDWSATIAAAVGGALILGGLNLHGDVRLAIAQLAETRVVAADAKGKAQDLATSVAGVTSTLEALRQDVDKLGDAVEKQATEAARDRALILQELGRLQGANENGRGGTR